MPPGAPPRPGVRPPQLLGRAGRRRGSRPPVVVERVPHPEVVPPSVVGPRGRVRDDRAAVVGRLVRVSVGRVPAVTRWVWGDEVSHRYPPVRVSRPSAAATPLYAD